MNKQAIFEGRKPTVSPRSLNGLLAILKNTLELEQFTNWNQEFTQWTNREQWGQQRNPEDTIYLQEMLVLQFMFSPKPRGKP